MPGRLPVPRQPDTGTLGGRSGPGLRWPRACVLCRQWGRQSLCNACQDRFVGTRPAACLRCAAPVPGLAVGPAICGNCQHTPPPYQRCIAAVDYGFPWDRLVARLKFQQQPELARLLAGVVHQALLQQGLAQTDPVRPGQVQPATVQQALKPMLAQPEQTRVDWLLPVPLSDARLAERGYNQAWELARHLAGRLGLPARADTLLRLRDTPHQVGLGRAARERNLRDAMWVPPAAAAALAGRHVALVDDVLTTGVTAATATQVLLAAGAAGVQVWVLARTPSALG